MYHKIKDQELNPEKYRLADVVSATKEDECFNLMTKPRQTQESVALYLRKRKEDANNPPKLETCPDPEEESKFVRDERIAVENQLMRNKGFWVSKPQHSAPLTYKLLEHYSVDVPKRDLKGSSAFARPDFYELSYYMRLANQGLIHPDEESEEEDDSPGREDECHQLQKPRYVICDPCKGQKKKKAVEEEQEPKDLVEEMRMSGKRLKFGKILTGCQCDYYGEHNKKPVVWDNWYIDRVDMLRHHEMNKASLPFKSELLRKNYEKNPPVKFMAHEPGAKRTFPLYGITNL